MDTGLGREGYSIIGQGRIDEILSVKSGDRREIFEEAAGISRFRHRKEEAERKLERTQENLVRITDKIDALELQVEPLRQQSEKARKFLILRDELRGLEISLWLDQLEKIRSASRKTLSDYENALRQKGEVQQQVEDLYAAAEAFSAQMRDKDVETEGVRFQMMQREADANGLENAIAVLKTNIQNNLETPGPHPEGAGAAGGPGRLHRRPDWGEKDPAGGAGGPECGPASAAGRPPEGGRLRQPLRRGHRPGAGAFAPEGGGGERLRRRRQGPHLALAAAAQEVLDRDEAMRQELASGEERLHEAEENRRQAAPRAGPGQRGPGQPTEHHQRLCPAGGGPAAEGQGGGRAPRSSSRWRTTL